MRMRMSIPAKIVLYTFLVIVVIITFIPLFYKNRYLIATAGNRDIVFDPFTGSADFISAKYLPD